jgi:hypothetical protein
MAPVGDDKTAFNGDAESFERVDLLKEGRGVQNDPGSNYADDAIVKNP